MWFTFYISLMQKCGTDKIKQGYNIWVRFNCYSFKKKCGLDAYEQVV